MVDIEVIIALACSAGVIGKQIQNSDFTAEQKADGSPVTEADRRMNDVLVPTLSEFYPVLSEESNLPS